MTLKAQQPVTTSTSMTVTVSPGPLAISDVRVALIRSTPLALMMLPLNETGTATVNGLTRGRYFVGARGWLKDRAWAAFRVVDFVPPSAHVSLRMIKAGRLTGRIVAENGGVLPLNGVSVVAAWTHEDVEINPLVPDQAQVAANGAFRIEGLFGKRSIQLIGLSPEWRVRSVRRGRSDVTSGVDVPLDSAVKITIVVARR
jgi:hypothetical protein